MEHGLTVSVQKNPTVEARFPDSHKIAHLQFVPLDRTAGKNLNIIRRL